jgi:spermidine/putrescine transport system ATP-binding protein
VGARVHVSLRPERLYLSETPREADSFPGHVRETIFIGTDTATMIDLHNGPSLTVRASNSARGNARLYAPGTPVTVNMEHGAARLLID